MRYRTLGNSPLEVSEIGLGCMSLPADERVSREIIACAIDGGINFFDTADLYGRGENESLLGRCLGTNRSRVLIATKVGNRWEDGRPGWTWNPTKAYIHQAVRDSLRRLQTDYIDLYQLHGGLLEDPMDEVIEAFEELKQAGLIRCYGISSIRPPVIEAYLQRSNMASVMMQYSILDRRPEAAALDTISALGRSVIARGVLGRGVLTWNYARKANEGTYIHYNPSEVLHLVDRMKALPEYPLYDHIGMALAYVWSHPAVATAIPGVRTVEQMAEVVRAADASLTPASLRQIREWSKPMSYAARARV